MTIWIEAQFSPAIAAWISNTFAVLTVAIRDVGLRDAADKEILDAARRAEVVVMTKGRDFVRLLDQLGAPPQVLWVTCGNTSNARLREILTDTFPKALELLNAGEDLIEISSSL